MLCSAAEDKGKVMKTGAPSVQELSIEANKKTNPSQRQFSRFSRRKQNTKYRCHLYSYKIKILTQHLKNLSTSFSK